jgi:hypothetical protein
LLAKKFGILINFIYFWFQKIWVVTDTDVRFIQRSLHLCLYLLRFFGVGPIGGVVGQGGARDQINLVLNAP